MKLKSLSQCNATASEEIVGKISALVQTKGKVNAL